MSGFLCKIFAFALFFGPVSSIAFAGEDCPTTPTKNKAAWCTYGLAGGIVPIARTGNELWTPLPVEYRVCIADKVVSGSTVTIFHGPNNNGNERTVLTEQKRCGCFTTTLLQLQYAGPHPQRDTIGGTYEAFVKGQCEKNEVPVRIGPLRQVTAQCRDYPDGSECNVPLDIDESRDYRVCFGKDYIGDPSPGLRLRANDFEFGVYAPAPQNGYDPRDAQITTSCMDVYGVDTMKIVSVKKFPPKTAIKLQLQPISSFNSK